MSAARSGQSRSDGESPARLEIGLKCRQSRFRARIGVPSGVANTRSLFWYSGPAFSRSSAWCLLWAVSSATIDGDSGILRRLCLVFGSEKYQPPPLRLNNALCTTAVPFSSSMSFHCRARYSSGRIPVAKAVAKIGCQRSAAAAFIKRSTSETESDCISFRVAFGWVVT